MEGDEHHGSWVGEYIWGRYGDWRKVSYSHLVFDYILWKVMSIMGHGLVSTSEEGMVIGVRLGTLTLYLITSYGRWWAPWTMDWWVTSEEDMVTCVRLGTLNLLLVTFCGRWGAPWVCELHPMKVWCPLMVRYSHLVFDYILWNVMSIHGPWVGELHLRKV